MPKPDIEKVLGGLPTGVALSFARCTPAPDDPDGQKPPLEVVVGLQFSEKGFGFGEICLRQTPEGLFLDTECMSLDRVKRYVALLLDQAVTDNDETPEKHQLYNRVMGRQCGEVCPVCYPPAT